MQLTSLSRPSGRVQVQRSFQAGTSHKQMPAAPVSLVTAPADSSSEIQRILENYSRQIAQTEEQMYVIRQSHQQVKLEHVVDLQAVSSAKATAQHADEASAMLAAEVHQLQMEINAKQADCSRIKTELAKLVESGAAATATISIDRHQFVFECQDIDKQLRLLLDSRNSPDSCVN